MDVMKLIKVTWEATPEAQKELDKFVEKWKQKPRISLDDLIQFGSKETTPSVSLTDYALNALMVELSYRCRIETYRSMRSRMARPLSLVPAYSWASRIHFENGTATYTAGQDSTAEIARIRKDILKS